MVTPRSLGAMRSKTVRQLVMFAVAAAAFVVSYGLLEFRTGVRWYLYLQQPSGSLASYQIGATVH